MLHADLPYSIVRLLSVHVVRDSVLGTPKRKTERKV